VEATTATEDVPEAGPTSKGETGTPYWEALAVVQYCSNVCKKFLKI
jgi:hypothetical protein